MYGRFLVGTRLIKTQFGVSFLFLFQSPDFAISFSMLITCSYDRYRFYRGIFYAATFLFSSNSHTVSKIIVGLIQLGISGGFCVAAFADIYLITKVSEEAGWCRRTVFPMSAKGAILNLPNDVDLFAGASYISKFRSKYGESSGRIHDWILQKRTRARCRDECGPSCGATAVRAIAVTTTGIKSLLNSGKPLVYRLTRVYKMSNV